MRFLEASHVVEIMREAGPAGLHVQDLASRVDCDPNKLGWFSARSIWLHTPDVAKNKVTFSGYLRHTTSGRRFPRMFLRTTGSRRLLIPERISRRSRRSE